MSRRYPSGFISAFYNPLEVPDAPTSVSASGGDASASVSFTAPADIGGAAITAYYAVSNPGQFTGTASASPVTVSGLTNGTSYTFTVWALNSYGPSPYSGASGSVTPAAPARAAFFAGYNSSFALVNNIQYITIASAGNASDFGDLSQAVLQSAKGCAGSSTRSLRFSGSTNGSDAGATNVIEYFNLSTAGNASDFGDLTTSIWAAMSLSNSTRALHAGGVSSAGASLNTIEYITISSVGNSLDFGDLTTANENGGGMASSTRGIIGLSTSAATINYVTIASTGNAVTFGSYTTAPSYFATASNGTRGLFAGGYATTDYSNVIEYITIASTGNTTDFGDLTVGRNGVAGAAGDTRAVFGGGYDASGMSNVIDYVTISSIGNATNFGDLRGGAGWWRTGAASNGHGGLA